MLDAEAHRFAAAWVAAWNRRDLDAIVEHYADDIVLTSPLVARRFVRVDGTLRGRDELREYVAVGLHSAPNLRIEPHHTLVGMDGVTVVYTRENGALVAEVMILNAQGKVRRARAFYHGLFLPEWPPD
jgi:ketosteroid isomerase-like protein